MKPSTATIVHRITGALSKLNATFEANITIFRDVERSIGHYLHVKGTVDNGTIVLTARLTPPEKPE